MNTYQVEVNFDSKFLINIKADNKEEAKRIAIETFEDIKVKDALIIGSTANGIKRGGDGNEL